MLSKSAARAFFFIGTIGFSVIFLGLTLDTMRQVPKQTNAANLTPQAIEGKHLWEKNNCMGCHTLLGEGAYYAPELTKVYDRRGPEFIKAMLRDPEAMYPGQRRMVKYEFAPEEIDALVAFFKWIGEMDLNGFPPKPTLLPVAVPSPTGSDALAEVERPKVFNQLCIACHSFRGQGGAVGPALDGVGSRRSYDNLIAWLTDPQKLKPGTAMPKLPLSPSDITELASFLSQLKQPPDKSTGQQG
ncbi:MAG: cytochrome c [Candidatus Tectomicrobia bacterium]|nr:cytochrome c [Candidatus Tectomicrobia bacterium]